MRSVPVGCHGHDNIIAGVHALDFFNFGEHMNGLYGPRRKKHARGQSIGAALSPGVKVTPDCCVKSCSFTCCGK